MRQLEWAKAFQSEEKYHYKGSLLLHYLHSLISGNVILQVSQTEALILNWVGVQTPAWRQVFCGEEPEDQVCMTLSFPSSVKHILCLAPNFMLRCFIYINKYMVGLNPAPPPKSRTGTDRTLGKQWRLRVFLFGYLVVHFLQSGLWICVPLLLFQNHQCFSV